MISEIKFEHGEKTCDQCIFAKAFGFMNQRHVCQVFMSTLANDEDKLERCPQCVERFGEKA